MPIQIECLSRSNNLFLQQLTKDIITTFKQYSTSLMHVRRIPLLLYMNAGNLHLSRLHGKYEGFHGRTKIHGSGWLLEESLTRSS